MGRILHRVNHIYDKRIFQFVKESFLIHYTWYTFFGDDPKMIRRPGGVEIPIPDSFFVILADPTQYPYDRARNVRFLAMEIPQDAGYVALDENAFSKSITEIEGKTGLNFFPDLSERERQRVEEPEWPTWVEEDD